MTERENIRKAICFDHPDHIPMTFSINAACWKAYPQEALCELIERHPLLFPNFKRPELPFTPTYSLVARKDEPFTDDFGCVWKTTTDGITGTVVEHPLDDWDKFETYRAPDPEYCCGIGPVDWDAIQKGIRARQAAGQFVTGDLRHGHTFLQLCDIRGYENLLFDMEDEEPRLWKLIELVERFNAGIVQKYVDMDVDMVTYAEDLGMQIGPMLSPEQFKTYIQPSYRRLIRPAREKGKLIHMHSDGDIRLLADLIIDSGVDVLNLQDLVNGLDWIREHFRGKTCIELDIDRQSVTRFGTPQDVDTLIREEVEKLGDPAGGLMMIYGLYPGIPLENVSALMDAMERYQ